MDAATWTQVCEIFDRLVDLPPDQRATTLHSEIPDPTNQIRQQVERMLSADGTSQALDEPAARIPAFEEPGEGAPEVGTHVGGFELLEVLAEGGMATVYRARQLDPERLVALKMRRGDPFSASGLRRFQYEADVLASMHHPGIAQLYEAGTHWRKIGGQWAQQPYVAIEFVDGARDIVSHARNNKLDLEQRLRLFEQVCDAVAYAHRNGILHRDLKAENILVDADGRVRVIDFGIAQATNLADAQERLTEEGQIVGTLATMSPEQLQGADARVDARSDVYSLGSVLYELLEERAPRELAGLSLSDAVDAVRGAPLPAPTKAPRELQWVLVKAMDSEPDRRYGSVQELTEDLARYRNHEPVRAASPSRWYALKKFVRRHRTLVLASVAVLAALSIGLVRAESARRQAVLAKEEAWDETRRVGAVHDFLLEMFENAGGPDATVIDLLDSGRSQLGILFADQPDLKAEVEAMLGKTYFHLQHFQQGGQLLRSARAFEQAHGIQGDRSWFRIQMSMAALHLQEERYDTGLEHIDVLLALADDSLELGPQTLATLHGQRGIMLHRSGQHDEAAHSFERALQLYRDHDLTQTQEYCSALEVNAGLQVDRGQNEEALENMRTSLAIREALSGPADGSLAGTLTLLGSTYQRLGQHEDALPYLERGLDLSDQVRGPDHFLRAQTLSNLAVAYMQVARFDEARAMFAECIDMCRTYEGSALGRSSVRFAGFMAVVNVAFLDQHQGETDKALAGFEQAIVEFPEQEGSSNYRVVQRTLAQEYYKLDRLEPALEFARASCQDLDREPNPSQRFACLSVLIDLSLLAGDVDGLEQRVQAEIAALQAKGEDTERVRGLLEKLQASE